MHSRFDLNALDPLVAPQLGDRRPPPPRKPPVAQRVCRPTPDRAGVYLNPVDGKMFTQFSPMPKASENDAMVERDRGTPPKFPSSTSALSVEFEGALRGEGVFLVKPPSPVERIVPLDELVRTTAQETAAEEVKKLISELQAQQQRICGLEAQRQAQRRTWRTHLPRQPRGIGMSNMSNYDYMPPEELWATFGNIEVQMANGCLCCTPAGSVNWGYDPVGGQHVVSWRYLT